MGQIQRLTRGQAKPYASIPRIDWAHPLAQKLAIYCYDIGGTYVDLINGGLSTLVSTSGRANSKFGQGALFPSATSYGFMPQNANATAVGQTAPYSVAIATFYPSAVGGFDGTLVCTGEVANTGNTATGFTTGNPATLMGAVYNNGGSLQNYNQAVAVATFQSWGYTAKSASAGDLYANGALDKSATGITTTLAVGTSQVMFNSAQANAQTFGGGLNGFLPYFAIWNNRVLTAADWRLLHDDPYCFLIYPEDEDRLVGVAAGGGTAVVADSGGAVEFTASVRRDAGDLLEFIASIRADSTQQLEAIAAVRSDTASWPEFVAGLSASTASQLEFLGSMRGDNAAPLETVAAFRADIIALAEAVAARRIDAGAAAEILAALRSDLIGALENLGGVAVVADAGLPIEITAAARADSVGQNETTSTVRPDTSGAVEDVAGIADASGVTLENVAGVQGNSVPQTEIQGGVNVVASSTVQLETTGALRADATVATETTGALRLDTTATFESGSGVKSDAALTAENLVATQADSVEQSEALGVVSVAANSAAPLDIIATPAPLSANTGDGGKFKKFKKPKSPADMPNERPDGTVPLVSNPVDMLTEADRYRQNQEAKRASLRPKASPSKTELLASVAPVALAPPAVAAPKKAAPSANALAKVTGALAPPAAAPGPNPALAAMEAEAERLAQEEQDEEDEIIALLLTA